MDNQVVSKETILIINENNCPIRTVLDILGGKWAFSIVYSLLEGKKRFKELERSIEGINTRMLVKELQLLQFIAIIAYYIESFLLIIIIIIIIIVFTAFLAHRSGVI